VQNQSRPFLSGEIYCGGSLNQLWFSRDFVGVVDTFELSFSVGFMRGGGGGAKLHTMQSMSVFVSSLRSACPQRGIYALQSSLSICGKDESVPMPDCTAKRPVSWSTVSALMSVLLSRQQLTKHKDLNDTPRMTGPEVSVLEGASRGIH